jgi:hypothetical protein
MVVTYLYCAAGVEVSHTVMVSHILLTLCEGFSNVCHRKMPSIFTNLVSVAGVKISDFLFSLHTFLRIQQ